MSGQMSQNDDENLLRERRSSAFLSVFLKNKQTVCKEMVTYTSTCVCIGKSHSSSEKLEEK